MARWIGMASQTPPSTIGIWSTYEIGHITGKEQDALQASIVRLKSCLSSIYSALPVRQLLVTITKRPG